MTKEPKKILLTGATGFLGSYIAKELLNQGYHVRALVRNSSQAKLTSLGLEAVEAVTGNLTDIDSLHNAVQGVDGIIHAACTFEHAEVDVAAMNALLESWQQGSFVFISSVDVYGIPKFLPVTEEHPYGENLKDYANGKVQAEKALIEVAKSKDSTNYTILRPPNIWSNDPRSFQQVFYPLYEIINKIRENETIYLKHKNCSDAWIDARELAAIAVACLDTTFFKSKAINTVNSNFKWVDVFNKLIELNESASQVKFDKSEATTFFSQTWEYDNSLLNSTIDSIRYDLTTTLEVAGSI